MSGAVHIQQPQAIDAPFEKANIELGPPVGSNEKPSNGDPHLHLNGTDREKAHDQPVSTSPSSPMSPHPYAQPGADPAETPAQPKTTKAVSTSTTTPTSKPTAQPSARAGPSRHILSSHVAKHPQDSVKVAISKQFPKPNPIIRLAHRFKVKHSVIKGMTAKEWKHWDAKGPELRKKAGWKMVEGEEGTPVGELFWKMYLSLMPTLERDPLSGLTSPDLLGSTSTIPLTIISLIPDIMRHYRDVIVRAEKEVFLATNYWQPSNSVNTITGSLKELSDLVVKNNRPKVIVKIMYDRGSVEQLWNSHAAVAPDKWEAIDLPKKEDIPGLDLEVINFHRVLLGTFHAKFLIVDRKVALLNSNNIQDRPNLELMSHLEGPIVDSFYEVALHSWYNRLDPPLPCIADTYHPPTTANGEVHYRFSDQNPFLQDIEIVRAAKEARSRLRQETMATDAEMARAQEHGVDRLRDAVRRVVDQQRQSLADWRPGERIDESVQNAMHELREIRDRWAAGMSGDKSKSRPNSRGPSRRSSAHEGMLRSLMRGGDKPGESTVAPLHPPNQAQAQEAESEAPSSPTMTDIPVKSHTAPPPGTAGREIDDDSRNHVAFAPLDTQIDGSGKFMDTEIRDEPRVLDSKSKYAAQPSLAIPKAQFGQRLTASPASASTHLPETPTSILASSEPTRKGSAPGSPILRAQGSSNRNDTAHVAISTLTPAKEGKTTAERIADRTVAEELTAEANEGEETLPALPHPAMMDGARSETATIDGVPIGSASLGPVDSEVPEGKGTKRLYKMSKMFNAAGVLSEAWATVEDSDELDNFGPHVVHAPHEPVPVAMCCRKPHGFPGHHDIRNPQNAAWLAGFRYAKKKVFIQSPTLNARPIVRAIKQACRRGVEVILLLDLGFNDKGESIPFQGGTNEEVVDRLYKTLGKEKKEQYLKVYWYTGKDQVRPLNAVVKQRNCHIKFAAYDDEVLIIGNGNQDSQSWFHSQEVNVMVDSKQIVKEMMDQLLLNQNTIEYGLVDSDGVWRDKEGKTLKDYGATSDGTFRGLSGFIAFAKTI